MTNAELAVALDVGSADEIPGVLDRLPDTIRWYKVGLELYTAAGPAALRVLQERNKKIFLDLKLHDIPNTVAGAVRSASKLGVHLVTVHAVGGKAMLKAAADAAREAGDARLRLVAVTTLTSLAQDDLHDLGIQRTVPEQALELGKLALGNGIDGLVCSVHEAEALRKQFGPDPILVTPGIRLPGESVGDQKRVATPDEAVRRGSSLLVVGRSLLQAPDPRATAERILAAMKT
jgi:orotidine-5'-phosphate decarboxylase